MKDFEDIYNAYAKQVFRICLGYTNDADKAKDLVQETFISVWKNLSSFENRSLMTTWIFRIATNNCLRHLEIEKRKERTLLPSNLMLDDTTGKEDQIQFLYKCISELAETDRIIISLDLEELPQAEIAAIVGLSHSTIRVRVHRIKDKLKQKFQEHGQFS
ncbi:RNA polymerase sigma factor [Mucilaginibacter ginkgonis]|uniref:RNA polymerase sigma factor n=1 Tax=Mucilaginibacter ginkgonis TaxID=2682091 RepID=A0A6I4IMP6_9SPHI|nr:RNA polymerase sigma factor [Mucilaginibacter ginkgonis]QQL49930.1 RNA polymerase sigma factor [Mucilaginibacter ginkgonis]